jgi:hypothetical protein
VFECFDDSNPFEPIKLGSAIWHPIFAWQLTAVIRDETPPCVDHDRSPVRNYFGLGEDMTVNTIHGMPIIKNLGMLPNFRAALVTCEATAATFDIRCHETCCGFPANDDSAAAFSTPPIDNIHPHLLASDIPIAKLPANRPSDPCVAATDDHAQGFLQRPLHSL